MAVEKRSPRPPSRRGLPLPAVVLIAALAILGAITLVQWTLVAFLGLIRIAILIVVVVAVGAWVISAKSSR